MNSYYVYFLIDPRDDSVFYVGKGKGKRMFTHVKQARRGIIDNVDKYKRIIEIQALGLEVVEYIKKDNLNEAEAYKLEKELITQMRLIGITNIVNGIVTSKEVMYKKAVFMKERLKPYSIWIKGLSKENKEILTRIKGSPRNFYDGFVDTLNMMIQRLAVSE